MAAAARRRAQLVGRRPRRSARSPRGNRSARAQRTRAATTRPPAQSARHLAATAAVASTCMSSPACRPDTDARASFGPSAPLSHSSTAAVRRAARRPPAGRHVRRPGAAAVRPGTALPGLDHAAPDQQQRAQRRDARIRRRGVAQRPGERRRLARGALGRLVLERVHDARQGRSARRAPAPPCPGSAIDPLSGSGRACRRDPPRRRRGWACTGRRRSETGACPGPRRAPASWWRTSRGPDRRAQRSGRVRPLAGGRAARASPLDIDTPLRGRSRRRSPPGSSSRRLGPGTARRSAAPCRACVLNICAAATRSFFQVTILSSALLERRVVAATSRSRRAAHPRCRGHRTSSPA